MRRALRVALGAAALVALACVARASPESWEPARPGFRFAFPADYGAHERARNEWWYYTGNLRDPHGRRFGFELIVFRYGVQHPIARGSAWDINDLYLAHFAVSDVSGHTFLFADRTGRSALGFAGAHVGNEIAWVGDWRVQRDAGGAHVLQAASSPLTSTASASSEASLNLRLLPLKHAVVHGRDGVSRKGLCATCASHYYSFTRLAATGRLRVGDRSFDVAGLAWNDHEWGSDELAGDVVGWDWFSLQLDDNVELMLYRLRHKDGSAILQSSGTLVRADGSSQFLALSDLTIASSGTWVSPHDGARYPSGWTVELRREHLRLTVTPVLEDQELSTSRSTRVSYWEGACDVAGTFKGRHVRGEGYVELTGYAPGGLGSLR